MAEVAYGRGGEHDAPCVVAIGDITADHCHWCGPTLRVSPADAEAIAKYLTNRDAIRAALEQLVRMALQVGKDAEKAFALLREFAERNLVECADCNGMGSILEHACPTCEGGGRLWRQ